MIRLSLQLRIMNIFCPKLERYFYPSEVQVIYFCYALRKNGRTFKRLRTVYCIYIIKPRLNKLALIWDICIENQMKLNRVTGILRTERTNAFHNKLKKS